MAACSSTVLWAVDSYWLYVRDYIAIFLYEVKRKKNKTRFNLKNPFFFYQITRVNKDSISMYFSVK